MGLVWPLGQALRLHIADASQFAWTVLHVRQPLTGAQKHRVGSDGLIPVMLSSMLHCHTQIEKEFYAAALRRSLASLRLVCVSDIFSCVSCDHLAH